MKAELLRKGIHSLIAFIPLLAVYNRSLTAMLLMIGILFYVFAESFRYLGFSPAFISSITTIVLRKKEEGHFALAPVTLGIGALLSILIFPPEVATLSIYILAFGDSAGTIVGKFFGRLRPAILLGKSIEGSLACFTVSFIAAYIVINNWKIALAAAFAALIIDMIKLGDLDNILMPLAAGFSASIMLFLI